MVPHHEKYAGKWSIKNGLAKCCYENDEVLVVHNIISFPDGSKEAALACHTKKDGKIISTETGATPLK